MNCGLKKRNRWLENVMIQLNRHVMIQLNKTFVFRDGSWALKVLCFYFLTIFIAFMIINAGNK